MYLIYGKNKVGQAVAALCEYLGISYEMLDDSDGVTSFEKYEVIIPSPGVPGTHPVYTTGKVMSELDFAYRYLPKGSEIISVTGTDGKSTTAWIFYSILQKEYIGKKKVFLSGNFDIPFSATVLDILLSHTKKSLIVLEVSSFMSHRLESFQCDYSIFTNLRRDHLNWHRDLQEYLDAKMHIISRTRKKSIINRQVGEFAKENNLSITLPEGLRIFSQNKKMTPRDWTDGEDIAISGRRKYTLSETHFPGIHNAMNLLSATMVTNELGICSKRIKKYLADITGLPHRLENVGEKNGIIFIEDSKSTSSQSLEAALGAFGHEKNLLLIVGGSDKGDTFAHLVPQFHKRVKALVSIGATRDQFVAIAKEMHIPYRATDILSEGVKWLYEQGDIGDILILSPGCASFGLFRDYLDRALQFREALKNLP